MNSSGLASSSIEGKRGRPEFSRWPIDHASHPNRGLMTERGLKHVISCVEAMKKVLGDERGLALDCGPGWMMKDAVTFARACEPMHITWI